MPHDEHGNYYVTMVTPGVPRSVPRAAARPLAVVDPADPEWKQAGAKLHNLAIAEAGPTPAEFSAAFDRVCRAHPELTAVWDAMGRPPRAVPGGNPPTPKAVVVNDQRPSPRPPLRRARLTADGHAVSWTPTGLIVDDLEIVHEPSFEEASREIGARHRKYILAGVEPHAALDQALEEVHPVYRNAYTR